MAWCMVFITLANTGRKSSDLAAKVSSKKELSKKY